MVAIEAGFAMDRSVESTQAMWKGLDKNKDGEVIKRRGDYAERLGLCHEPNIVRPTLSFTITHKWMCAANHKVKIALHVMVGHYKWVEDASIKPRIKEAKEILQKALKPGQIVGGSVRENIGVAYGYPAPELLMLVLYVIMIYMMILMITLFMLQKLKAWH